MDWRKTLVLLIGASVGSAFAQAPPLVVVKKVTGAPRAQQTAATANSAAGEPFEFMGILVGAPLVSECPRSRAPRAEMIYDLSAAQTACWATATMRADSRTDARNNTHLTLVPLGTKRPTGTKEVTASVLEGIVEGLSVSTDGFVHAQELFDQLKQKLGEPTLQDVVQVTSGVGAAFSSPRAVWDLPDVYVKFNGITGSVNSGLIVVYTHAEKDRVLARERASAKSF